MLTKAKHTAARRGSLKAKAMAATIVCSVRSSSAYHRGKRVRERMGTRLYMDHVISAHSRLRIASSLGRVAEDGS